MKGRHTETAENCGAQGLIAVVAMVDIACVELGVMEYPKPTKIEGEGITGELASPAPPPPARQGGTNHEPRPTCPIPYLAGKLA